MNPDTCVQSLYSSHSNQLLALASMDFHSDSNSLLQSVGGDLFFPLKKPTEN